MKQSSPFNFGQAQLPVVIASQPAETGLACLVMVARWHGRQTNLNSLRETLPGISTGLSLDAMLRVADQLGLSMRLIRADAVGRTKVRLPALLQLDASRWVALKRWDRTSAIVHDPLGGIRTIALEEAQQAALFEVTPVAGFVDGPGEPRFQFRELWTSSRGVRSALLQVFLLSVAFQIVAFAAPFQMQLVIDEGIQRGDLDLLLLIAVAFGFIAIVQQVLEAVRSWTLQVVTQSLGFHITGNVVRHLMHLPYPFFEKRHLGDVLSRLGSAKAIQDILTRGVVSAVLDGLMALVALVILFAYSAQLTFVVIGSLVIVSLINFVSFPLLRARNEMEISQRAREQSQVMEMVRSSMTIKLMGGEMERLGSWRGLLADATNAALSSSSANIFVGLLRNTVIGLQAVIIVYLGAREVLTGGGFSMGMLVAYLSFRTTFTDRMLSLVNQLQQFRFIGLHIDRLSDIVDAKAEPVSVRSLSVTGRLEFREVSFAYDGGNRKVLEAINLKIEPGDFIAITGPSGGGKTTLLKLMLGLHSPLSGQILLEGEPVGPEIWPAWRRHVGVVAQDDRLLSGSIAENISFFDPDMDMTRVEEAAHKARIAADIGSMSLRYSTMIGDMGAALSTGQRQRILLARALYRRPTVLILDEGTANLDVGTEEEIAELVREMSITRIVVAHRPALVHLADRVLTLDGGLLREVVT